MKRQILTYQFECTYCPNKTTMTILEGEMRGFTVPPGWDAQSVLYRAGDENKSQVTHICPDCQKRRKPT